MYGGVVYKDWWDSIVFFLVLICCVVVLDLFGMGDSDYCEKYCMDFYVKEVMIVVCEGGVFNVGVFYVVGYFFGGFVSLVMVMEYGEVLCGVVILDSLICLLEE